MIILISIHVINYDNFSSLTDSWTMHHRIYGHNKSNTHQINPQYQFNQCELHTAIKHTAGMYILLHRWALHTDQSISVSRNFLTSIQHSVEVIEFKMHCPLTNTIYHVLQPTTYATLPHNDLSSLCPVHLHHTPSSPSAIHCFFLAILSLITQSPTSTILEDIGQRNLLESDQVLSPFSWIKIKTGQHTSMTK